jgi:hypothetical protein
MTRSKTIVMHHWKLVLCYFQFNESITRVDLHCSITHTRQPPKTHMMVVIHCIVCSLCHNGFKVQHTCHLDRWYHWWRLHNYHNPRYWDRGDELQSTCFLHLIGIASMRGQCQLWCNRKLSNRITYLLTYLHTYIEGVRLTSFFNPKPQAFQLPA